MTRAHRVTTASLVAFVLAHVLLPSSAAAQRFEIAPFVGVTTASELKQTAPEVSELEFADGFTWGVEFGYFFTPRVGVEVAWAQHETGLELSTPSGEATLFDIDARQLHGNVVYQLRDETARVRPFALFGVGATSFHAVGLESETKLSWAVGGGVKVFLQSHVGLKFEATYNPTRLDAESDELCDPFGFCADALNQFQLGGGFVFRF